VSPEPTVYDVLAELAERKLALALGGQLEQLEALAREQDAFVASFPAHPPATARPALERAAALQARTTAILADAHESARQRLATLDQAVRTARGYGATVPTQAPRASLDRVG
jgi:hypothetical protein